MKKQFSRVEQTKRNQSLPYNEKSRSSRIPQTITFNKTSKTLAFTKTERKSCWYF